VAAHFVGGSARHDSREVCRRETALRSRSVVLAKGIYCRQADYVSRLGNAFGTPNVTSIDNTCYVPSAAGRLLTYGFDGMPDLAGGRNACCCGGTVPIRR